MKTILILATALLFTLSCKKYKSIEPETMSTQPVKVDSLYRHMGIFAQCDSFSVGVNGTILWNMTMSGVAINRDYIFYKGDLVSINCKGAVKEPQDSIATIFVQEGYYGTWPILDFPSGMSTTNSTLTYTFIVK